MKHGATLVGVFAICSALIGSCVRDQPIDYQTSRATPAKVAAPAANDDAAPVVQDETTTVAEQDAVSTAAVSLEHQPSTNFVEVSTTSVYESQPPVTPPAQQPYRQPAALSGRYELRRFKIGWRTYEDRFVWVSYQPQSVGRATFGGCAGGNCGGRR